MFPPLAYQLASGASLLWYRKDRRYAAFRTRQIALILVLPAAMHVALGGLAASSVVILWSFLAPVIALLFDERRAGERWFAAFALQLVAVTLLEPVMPDAASIPEGLHLGFFALNLGAVTTLAFMTVRYYARLLRQEQKALVELGDRLEAQRAELERVSEHKTRFLRNMSHELRTPLTAIMGYAELLEEELTLAAQEELAQDARRVALAGRHLLSLIDQVLDLAKIESGKIVLEPMTIEVRGLIAEVEGMARPLVEAKKNVFAVEVAADVGSLYADRLRLKQVLANILSNAAKFTEAGSVQLAVRRVVEAGGAWLLFEVSDTGIGIAPADMAQLFQEYSPAALETARVFGGTGLGLALSRHLCRLMQGDISVVSAPGSGSTFTLRMPEDARALAG